MDPGRSKVKPSAVRCNQRERLFAATVACVSERGYGPVRVADLLALSGISRRTFYEEFADKRECFVAALDAMVEDARRNAEPIGARRPGEAWEERGLRTLLAFAAMVIEQPAAARAGLVDCAAAGNEALGRLETATETMEAVARELVEASPERAGMPAEVLTAQVGAVLELAATRLRQGLERELPQALEEAAPLLLSYRRPPRPLQLSVRPPRQGPERLEAADHADRAIRAFAIAVAEKGYAETSIEDVLRKASMSRSTFDANFADKQDLMAAAIDSACAQTVAAAAPAFARAGEWPRGVRAGYGAMLSFLASRPALAELLTVGVYAAGDEAVERRAAGLAPLQILLENNTTDWQNMPPIVYETLAGAVGGLLLRTVRRSGAAALPGLAPVCTYLTLSPFLGSDAACAVANTDGSGRREGEGEVGAWNGYPAPGSITFREPLRRTVWKAVAILSDRDATAAELAKELDEDETVVGDYLRQLTAAGAIDRIGDRDGEPLYGTPGLFPRIHKLNLVSNRQAARMNSAERRELSRLAWDQIEGDVEASIAEEVFDRRLDRYLTRTLLRLDEEGWRELTDLHEQTLHAGFEIQARSRRRLSKSGERGIAARSVQLAFEVSDPEG